MGHTRLGEIPKSKKWNQLVELAMGSAEEGFPSSRTLADDVALIAAETLRCAKVGLAKAIGDPGLRYTFYLLTQTVLAARKVDWQESLAENNIHLSQDSTVFDLTAEVQGAIDDYISARERHTDVSEMAQRAAGEALIVLAEPKANTLFGNGRDEVRMALRELSTKKGFSELGQTFFGRFMARFLNFYLSRITATYAGERKLQQIGDLSKFNEALQFHCTQSARIVYDFCGEWYSKTEYQEGINFENTSGFMAVALKKLQAELEQQGAGS